LRARIDDFFDHFPQLIDLDRKNAAIPVLVTEFGHRILERAVDRFHTVAQQILKTNDKRKPEPAIARFVDYFQEIDRSTIFLQGTRHDIARLIDGKVIATPTVHVVSRDRGFHVPFVFHFFQGRHISNAQHQLEQATCKRMTKKITRATRGAYACFSYRLAYRFAGMDKTVIEVQVRAVLPTSGGCAVFLGNNDKVFIIYVDQTVGSAITMFMREVAKERPLTHDLMGHLMTAVGAHVERVIINDLKNATYYARIIVCAENELQQKKIIELDARPSDCIAMATQQKAPIYVSQEVWEEVDDMSDVLRKMEEEGLKPDPETESSEEE
jgi:bifunctional DNase/RNase